MSCSARGLQAAHGARRRLAGCIVWFVAGSMLLGVLPGCEDSQPEQPATQPTPQPASQPANPPDPLVAEYIASLRGDEDPAARVAAANHLAELRHKAAPATAALIEALDDSDGTVRVAATEALGRIGPGAADAAGPLMGLLKANSVDLRAATALSLGSVGSSVAASATPPLIEALDDPEETVRVAAAKGLGRLGSGAADAAGPLMKLLDADSVDLRGAAAFSLGRLGPDAAASATPRLIEMVTDDHVDVQRRAATALGHLGRNHPQAVPTLIGAAKHTDSNVRNEAVLGLRSIGPSARDAAGVLVDIVHNDPDQRVRKHATLTVGRISPDPMIAVPGLADATRDSYTSVRYEAIVSMGLIGPDAAPAAAALAAAMDDPEKKVADAAVTYACRIGVAMVPYLKEIIQNPEAPNRTNAVKLLGLLDTVTPQIIAVLTDALGDEDPDIVVAAAKVLGGFGTDGFPAAATLTKLRKDPREPVAQAATAALQSLMRPNAGGQGR